MFSIIYRNPIDTNNLPDFGSLDLILYNKQFLLVLEVRDSNRELLSSATLDSDKLPVPSDYLSLVDDGIDRYRVKMGSGLANLINLYLQTPNAVTVELEISGWRFPSVRDNPFVSGAISEQDLLNELRRSDLMMQYILRVAELGGGTSIDVQNIENRITQEATARFEADQLKADKDLSNVSDADFSAKATSAGIGGGTGDVTEAEVDTKIADHNDSPIAHNSLFADKANQDLDNVSDADFSAKAASAGVGQGSGGLNTRASNLANDLTSDETKVIREKIKSANELAIIDRDPRPYSNVIGNIAGRSFLSTRDDVASITLENGTTLTVPEGRSIRNLQTPANFQTDIMAWQDDDDTWFILYHKSVDVPGRGNYIYFTEHENGDEVELETNSTAIDEVTVTLTNGDKIKMDRYNYTDHAEDWVINLTEGTTFQIDDWTIEGHSITTGVLEELDHPINTLALRIISKANNFRLVSLFFNNLDRIQSTSNSDDVTFWDTKGTHSATSRYIPGVVMSDGEGWATVPIDGTTPIVAQYTLYDEDNNPVPSFILIESNQVGISSLWLVHPISSTVVVPESISLRGTVCPKSSAPNLPVTIAGVTYDAGFADWHKYIPNVNIPLEVEGVANTLKFSASADGTEDYVGNEGNPLPFNNPVPVGKWEWLTDFVGASGDLADLEDMVALLESSKLDRNFSNLIPGHRDILKAYVGISDRLSRNLNNITDPLGVSAVTRSKIIGVLLGFYDKSTPPNLPDKAVIVTNKNPTTGGVGQGAIELNTDLIPDVENLKTGKEDKFIKGTRDPNRVDVQIGRGNTESANDTAVLSTSDLLRFAGLVAVDSTTDNAITKNISASQNEADIDLFFTSHYNTTDVSLYSYMELPSTVTGGAVTDNWVVSFDINELNDDGTILKTHSYEREGTPNATPDSTYNIVELPDHPNGVTRDAWRVRYRKTNTGAEADTVPDISKNFTVTNVVNGSGANAFTFGDAHTPAVRADQNQLYRQRESDSSRKILRDWEWDMYANKWIVVVDYTTIDDIKSDISDQELEIGKKLNLSLDNAPEVPLVTDSSNRNKWLSYIYSTIDSVQRSSFWQWILGNAEQTEKASILDNVVGTTGEAKQAVSRNADNDGIEYYNRLESNLESLAPVADISEEVKEKIRLLARTFGKYPVSTDSRDAKPSEGNPDAPRLIPFRVSNRFGAEPILARSADITELHTSFGGFHGSTGVNFSISAFDTPAGFNILDEDSGVTVPGLLMFSLSGNTGSGFYFLSMQFLLFHRPDTAQPVDFPDSIELAFTDFNGNPETANGVRSSAVTRRNYQANIGNGDETFVSLRYTFNINNNTNIFAHKSEIDAVFAEGNALPISFNNGSGRYKVRLLTEPQEALPSLGKGQAHINNVTGNLEWNRGTEEDVDWVDFNFANRPVFTDEDPGQDTIAAQPYQSTGDTPSDIFIGDSYDMDNLDNVSWQIPHGKNYTIKPGQEYKEARRLKTTREAWSSLKYMVSYNWDSANKRLLVVLHYDDATLNLGDVAGDELYDETLDIIFKNISDDTGLSANFGTGSTDNNTGTLTFVHLTDAGHSVNFNDYAEFAKRYRLGERKKLYYPSKTSPTFFTTPDSTFDIKAVKDGDSIIKEDAKGNYIEIIKKSIDKLIELGKSNGLFLTKQPYGTTTTERFNSSGSAATRGFAEGYANDANKDYMIYLANAMGRQCVLRGAQYTDVTPLQPGQRQVPDDYKSNFNIILIVAGSTVLRMPCALVFNRGPGSTAGIVSAKLLLSMPNINGLEDPSHDFYELIESLSITRGNTTLTVPAESPFRVANPSPGQAPYTISSSLTGMINAVEIGFDIDAANNDISDLDLRGSVHDLNFNINISEEPVIVQTVPVGMRFDKSIGDQLLERLTRKPIDGEVAYDSDSEVFDIGAGDKWHRLITEKPPSIIENDTRKTIVIPHYSKNFIADSRKSINHIYFDFEELISENRFNYLSGRKWRFTRWGDKWLAPVSTDSHTGLTWGKFNHGFKTGTLVHANHAIGTAAANTDLWIVKVDQNHFKLTTDFSKLHSTNDSDFLDAASLSATVTFTPRTATVLVRNIPGYRDVELLHDGQDLVIEYLGFRRFKVDFKRRSGWRDFGSVTGDSYLNDLKSIRCSYIHREGEVEILISGQVSADITNTLNQLPLHAVNLPFGLTLGEPFDNIFIKNSDAHAHSVSNRDVPIYVGELYYQRDGQDEHLLEGELRVNRHDRGKVRPYGVRGGGADGQQTFNLGSAVIGQNDTLNMRIWIPYKDIIEVNAT